jgi:hypothetical protein
LRSEAVTGNLERAPAVWLQWVLPSFADLFFLVLLCMLAFSPLSAGLLRDADTGWHIRSGELILTTHAVPRTDPFSYTKQGEPWYAWEWMYDIVIAAIHHVSGLNGVVLFTAAVISVTFALLFRFILRRSGNLAVAGFLTLLAAAAAQVHMLARPHVLSWLLALLWAETLFRFEDGESSALLWLPPLMLLWANVHAGFVLGLGLLGVFSIGRAWTALSAPREGDRRKIAQLAAILALCLLTTLLTPYGYRLHVHVYQYLSDSFLMNSIDEFPPCCLRVLRTISAAGDRGSGARSDQHNRVAAGVLLPTRGAICGAQHTYIRHPYEPGTWAAVDGGDLSEARLPPLSAMVTFPARYRTRHLGQDDAPRRPVPRACAGVGYDGRIRGTGLKRWARVFQADNLRPL